MKMPQFGTVTGGAFREYCNSIPNSQGVIDILIDTSSVAAFCAFNE